MLDLYSRNSIPHHASTQFNRLSERCSVCVFHQMYFDKLINCIIMNAFEGCCCHKLVDKSFVVQFSAHRLTPHTLF